MNLWRASRKRCARPSSLLRLAASLAASDEASGPPAVAPPVAMAAPADAMARDIVVTAASVRLCTSHASAVHPEQAFPLSPCRPRQSVGDPPRPLCLSFNDSPQMNLLGATSRGRPPFRLLRLPRRQRHQQTMDRRRQPACGLLSWTRGPILWPTAVSSPSATTVHLSRMFSRSPPSTSQAGCCVRPLQ